MEDDTRNGILGAALIGIGLGVTAVGIAMVVPACTNWSLGLFDEAVRRGRDTLHSSVETAASLAGNISGAAQRKFAEASQGARERTAKAADMVENAARYVREQTAS